MKNILRGAVAAVALMGIATSASAQTNQRHYAGTLNFNVFGTPVNLSGGITNPSNGLAGAADWVINNLSIGTRYTANTVASDNSAPAVTSITTVFTLSGKVTPDCSFYAGNDSSAQNLDFGTIGVRTGNNENVDSAFTMVAPAVATVKSLTAGCNTNNSLEIKKDNVLGLVNATPGGYDQNEFQANIPYSVVAAWKGVAKNAVTTGSNQNLTVGESTLQGLKEQGAWRSDLTITFTTQNVQSKGLVAGDYQGKTTVVLKAI